MLQAGGADAVGPLLVFLDLLERQPEGVPEIGLAHIEHEPSHAHAAANVDRIASSPGHRFPHWLQTVELNVPLAGHHAAKKRKRAGERQNRRIGLNVARLSQLLEWAVRPSSLPRSLSFAYPVATHSH